MSRSGQMRRQLDAVPSSQLRTLCRLDLMGAVGKNFGISALLNAHRRHRCVMIYEYKLRILPGRPKTNLTFSLLLNHHKLFLINAVH